jgi:hypothetical protein
MKNFPWWGSVLLAILTYCGLKYGSARIIATDSALGGLVPLFAPLAAMGFLLLAGKQLYDTDHKGTHNQEDDTTIPSEDQKNSDNQ